MKKHKKYIELSDTGILLNWHEFSKLNNDLVYRSTLTRKDKLIQDLLRDFLEANNKVVAALQLYNECSDLQGQLKGQEDVN